jgi:hypothetical protein
VSTRVYLPVTLEQLGRWVDTGQSPDGVERFMPDGTDEESEYAALMSAADASAALLEGRAGRRVVVVAELEDPDGAVPLALVVAVHADAEDRAAGADPDEDLGWYASQEIGDLIRD